MHRRTFIGSLATGLIAVTCGALAQSTRKVYRIGIFGMAVASEEMAGPQPRNPSTLAFVRGMRELGYAYGSDFVTEVRGAEGKPGRFPRLAAELVGLQVDVIVAPGPALPALMKVTSTIPVVMAASSDPVGLGYVQSLSRPGGNVTGLSLQSVETMGKRLELLEELVPGALPVAVLWDLGNLLFWKSAETAARARAWKLLSFEVRDVGQIEAAFKAATDARAGALLIDSGPVLFPQRRRVAELASKSRLPSMYELRPMVEAGGLISYGTEINETWRRAAMYVDKILKGAKPSDLPIEQPTKFELVINLTTAQALGITIPPSLLLRADDVIR
jgi:putative ABC transport system substrate-binding protein